MATFGNKSVFVKNITLIALEIARAVLLILALSLALDLLTHTNVCRIADADHSQEIAC